MYNKLFSRTSMTILLVIVIVVAVIVSLGHHSNKSESATVNTRFVTLNSIATVTFPCSTHGVTLASKVSTKIITRAAECVTYTNRGRQSFIYSAVLQHYPAKSSSQQQLSANYCTAQTSYVGATAGTTIYVLQPTTQVVANKQFKVCALSTNQATAYEATAKATNKSYNLTLAVDAVPTTNVSTILAAVHSFASTARFKQ